MVAPVSRFSKSARTGTRVPRKTQAPLTVSGERSTSRQSAQSNMQTMICFPFLASKSVDGKRILNAEVAEDFAEERRGKHPCRIKSRLVVR